MKQYTLELDKDAQRPIIHIPEFHNVDALLDTGSLFPVWCASEQQLQKFGGEKISDFAPFGGFGGNVVGKMYSLPTFQLGGLIYPHLKIIACEYPNMIMPLILPATMFNHLIYEIDNKHHCLNVTVPDDESHIRNLTIKEEDGRLHVFCTSAE